MEDSVSYCSSDSAGNGDYIVVNQSDSLSAMSLPSPTEPRMLRTVGSDSVSATSTILEQVESKMNDILQEPEAQHSNERAPENDSEPSVTKPTVCNTSPFPSSVGAIFPQVTYIGSTTVTSLRNMEEISRKLAAYCKHSSADPEVNLVIPASRDEPLLLLDVKTNTELKSFRVIRIGFCVAGRPNSDERCHFAFTYSDGDAPNVSMQCHVFRCTSVEQVGKVISTLATLFNNPLMSLTGSPSSSHSNPLPVSYRFKVTLDIQEDSNSSSLKGSSGTFSSVPKDRSNILKLRANVDKRIVIAVELLGVSSDSGFVDERTAAVPVIIERCFGVLMAPGRFVKASDLTLLEIAEASESSGRSVKVKAKWDVSERIFETLNTVSVQYAVSNAVSSSNTRDKESIRFMTVAADLVLVGLQDPVRFTLELQAKVFPENERFWVFQKRSIQEEFIVTLVRTLPDEKPRDRDQPPTVFKLLSVESRSEIERRRSNPAMSTSITSGSDRRAAQDARPVSPERDAASGAAEDPMIDDDEPLLSGSGTVSRDVKDEQLIEEWRDALRKWHATISSQPALGSQRERVVPNAVSKLILRSGVPEALRGEVWQLLAGCGSTGDAELYEAYRLLIMKQSSQEAVIKRDLSRTFPAHDYFRRSGGSGQDALFKLCKAYAIYDEEISYCQSLSFLGAALLLHMPEEQAFCVLVRMMFDCGIRNMYKDSFEELHLALYQLERAMRDELPDLFAHFVDLHLEAHMYASQWFLTLFTAKFPLPVVFYILDLFLCQGQEAIFRVAITLLEDARRDLLALDFDGCLKYFRVALPKRYFQEDGAALTLLRSAAQKRRITTKRLRAYEKDYREMLAEQFQVDPVKQLQVDVLRFREANVLLQSENDELAHEVVSSKLTLRAQLEQLEERLAAQGSDLAQARKLVRDLTEERDAVLRESGLLKDLCRRELEQASEESARSQRIVSEYKDICARQSERLEKLELLSDECQKVWQSCDRCAPRLNALFGVESVGEREADIEALVFEEASSTMSLSEAVGELSKARAHIRDLEMTLAHTKLELTLSRCNLEEVQHEARGVQSPLSGAHKGVKAGSLSAGSLFNKLKNSTTWSNMRSGLTSTSSTSPAPAGAGGLANEPSAATALTAASVTASLGISQLELNG